MSQPNKLIYFKQIDIVVNGGSIGLPGMNSCFTGSRRNYDMHCCRQLISVCVCVCVCMAEAIVRCKNVMLVSKVTNLCFILLFIYYLFIICGQWW